jgi:bacillithiol system protein YtxJ
VFEPLELTSSEEISEMLERSHIGPVLLYKHSISCPISGYAWYEVQDCLGLDEDAPACYRVTVQYHPDISRDIAERLEVIHHTPQVIIVRAGKASYVATHWQIRKQMLQRALVNAHPENHAD